jgi:hypothetical protein
VPGVREQDSLAEAADEQGKVGNKHAKKCQVKVGFEQARAPGAVIQIYQARDDIIE